MANKKNDSVDSIQSPMEITILDELKYFIPPLQAEEWNQLESNILAEGCRQSLSVWKTFSHIIDKSAAEPLAVVTILIDGHNRYEICRRHGLGFSVDFVDFESLQGAKNYMIEQQLGRRNLNSEQMAYLRGLRYNQDKQSKGRYERKKYSSHNDYYEEQSPTHPKTVEKVAELYQVSPKTIQRDADFATGLDKLTSDLRKDVLSGVVKVSKKEIQNLAKIVVDNPIGSFDELKVLNQPLKNIRTAETFTQDTTSLSEVVKKCVPNALDLDLSIQVKGRFLLENNLTETWKKLRGFDDSVVIDDSFTDTISIYEAPSLGLI
jgi:hypothetical protein